MASRVASLSQVAGCGCGPWTRAIRRPVAGGSLGPRSRAASALRMSRREMLGERQVAAPLMAQRAAHGALRPAHRRFQPGEGAGVQLAGLRLSGKPRRPSQCQFGHETLVLGCALIAPAASRPGQHCAVRRQRGRQRGRQVAPCCHPSTVGQRFLRLVLRDDQEERRRTSSPALAGRTPVRTVAAHATADTCAPRADRYQSLSVIRYRASRAAGSPAQHGWTGDRWLCGHAQVTLFWMPGSGVVFQDPAKAPPCCRASSPAAAAATG